MSRTLNDIPLGSSVWANENGTDTEFILIRKDQAGCEIIRKKGHSSRRMNPSNVTVYETSEIDGWLTNEETGYLSNFSANFLSCLSSRSISTFTYGDTDYHEISRKVYLPSYGDLFLNSPTELYKEVNITHSLMFNKNTMDANSGRICRNDADTENVYWWSRSAYSAANYWCVNNNGTSVNNRANDSIWIRPVLNLSPDTIVSDEGASIIYILPEEHPRVIEYIGRAGTSEARPKKIVVNTENNNLTNISVQVTNNFDDPNPVWYNAILGQVVTLTNDVKLSENWVIGIHFYAETADLTGGSTKEPYIYFI